MIAGKGFGLIGRDRVQATSKNESRANKRKIKPHALDEVQDLSALLYTSAKSQGCAGIRLYFCVYAETQ